MWRPWDNVNIAYDNADIVEIASASVNVITKKKRS